MESTLPLTDKGRVIALGFGRQLKDGESRQVVLDVYDPEADGDDARVVGCPVLLVRVSKYIVIATPDGENVLDYLIL